MERIKDVLYVKTRLTRELLIYIKTEGKKRSKNSEIGIDSTGKKWIFTTNDVYYFLLNDKQIFPK